MSRSHASTAGLMIGAFAVSFFATMLIRKSSPSADVALSAWTADAEAAAKTHDREDSLTRSVAALRLESRRLTEQLALKSRELTARVGKARSADPGTADPKTLPALDTMTGLLTKMVVREKLRVAQEDLGLRPPQLAAYEARLKEAVGKDPLLVVDNTTSGFDEQTLVPLLDREQLAVFQQRAKAEAESKSQSESKRFADLLEIPPDLAARVTAILQEEGVDDPNAFTRLIGKPESTRELVPHYAAVTERARARLRSLLSPEAFEKLERHFADEGEILKILVEELEKDSKKE